MNFDQAFERLIGHEGGFQNSPKDRGNWTGGVIGQGRCIGTKYGISAMSYPGEDIEHLTLERAKEIYKRDFWGPAGCDVVPDAVKFDLFDTAVNSGVLTAIKMLQRAAAVDGDGRIGPRTLLAANTMDPERLAARFNGWRLDFLNDNPRTWEAFGRGWAQRIADNLKAA